MSIQPDLCGFSGSNGDSYINSVVQSILNLNDFTGDLVKTFQKGKTSSSDEGSLTVLKNFANLISVVNDSPGEILNPLTFKKSVKNCFSRYKNNVTSENNVTATEKTDFESREASMDNAVNGRNKRTTTGPREFLIDLLDLLSDATSVPVKNYMYGNNHFKSANSLRNKFFDNKESIVTETLFGQFVSKCVCNDCDTVVFDYKNFLDITLFPKPDTSIKFLLNRYFDKDYQPYECLDCCPTGYVDKEHTIYKSLYRLPNVLMITLDRFAWDGTKNNGNVSIDEKLDLSEYLFSNTNESAIYTLSSIICHISIDNESSYLSIIKRNNEYYIAKDEKVKKLNGNIDTIGGSFSYICFYEKQKFE